MAVEYQCLRRATRGQAKVKRLHIYIQHPTKHILAMSTTATDITATNTSTTTTTRALNRALEANVAAEKAIVEEIQKLAVQKEENRKKAAQLTHALLISSLLITTENDAKEKQQQQHQQQPSLDTKKSLENIYRPWNRVFFSDCKSVPQPNDDTVRRRAVANNNQAFFYHTNPPWLAKESNVMLDLVQQQLQQEQMLKSQQQQQKAKAGAAATTETETALIDFEQVAQELHQRANQARGRNASFPSATAKPRSALECEIEYNRQMHEKNKKMKSTSKMNLVLSFKIIFKAISSLAPTASTTTAAAAADDDDASTRQGIDWQAVATWLQEHENIQTSAWECFAEYQKTTRRRQNNVGSSSTSTTAVIEPWTAKQDEVLLKYVAAMGPQALVDGHAMNHLLTRLLPNKSKSQILNRINHSLLNPTLRHDAWSGDEERLLTICMKMYSTEPTTTTMTNNADSKKIEKQALYLAGTHLPHRATASVLHKWHRTLNPDYDSGPFTKAEDQKLLQVLRSTQQQQQQQQLGWKELAQRHFPNRHAHRLMNRWSEIASNQDIIARFGNKDYFQKNHHDDKNNDNNTNNNNKRSSNRGRPLDTQDLVAPIKKKKKS